MAIDPELAAQGLVSEEAASDAAADAAVEQAAPQEVDIWSRIVEADPDPEELFQRLPKLRDHFNGQVGRHAQRQAQELAQHQMQAARAQLEAEARARAEELADQRRLADLRETDLYAWNEEEKKVREERERRAASTNEIERRAAFAAMNTHVSQDAQFLQGLFYQMPPEAQQRLGGKTYQTGSPAGDRLAAYEEITAEIQKAEVEKALAAQARSHKAKLAELEAQRKALDSEMLAHTNGAGDSSVDTGAGQPSDGVPSEQQWYAMSRDQRREWLKRDPNIEDRIAAMSNEGIPFSTLRYGGAR